jgi:hypothetical protein
MVVATTAKPPYQDFWREVLVDAAQQYFKGERAAHSDCWAFAAGRVL